MFARSQPAIKGVRRIRRSHGYAPTTRLLHRRATPTSRWRSETLKFMYRRKGSYDEDSQGSRALPSVHPSSQIPGPGSHAHSEVGSLTLKLISRRKDSYEVGCGRIRKIRAFQLVPRFQPSGPGRHTNSETEIFKNSSYKQKKLFRLTSSINQQEP